jgi:hypothetical protein
VRFAILVFSREALDGQPQLAGVCHSHHVGDGAGGETFLRLRREISDVSLPFLFRKFDEFGWLRNAILAYVVLERPARGSRDIKCKL